MTWEALSNANVSFTPSPLESKRFGRTIARITVGWNASAPEAPERVARAIDEASESLLILRWPTHMSSIATAAMRSTRTILVADVLTYWEVTPEKVLSLGRPPATRLAVVPAADEVDRAPSIIEHLVRDSFQAYGNHYTANPELDQEAALAGYVEWARRRFDASHADVLLLSEGSQAVGLATLQTSTDGRDLEIELAGIQSTHQGLGAYGHLLVGCANEALRRSCSRLIISTQVQNVHVQRAWVRAGLVPFAAFTTAHASHFEKEARGG